MIKDMKHLPYEKRLFSLEKRSLGKDLIDAYEYPKDRIQMDGAKLFPAMPSDRTRDNEHKLEHKKCHLNMRKPSLL